VVAAMTGFALARRALPLLAVLALSYLIVMVVVGAQPRQRQLVKFEANGVLRVAPEAVRQVMLSRGGEQAVLVRSGTGWAQPAAGAVAPAVATHLETAVTMLHRSAPVRELAAEDLVGGDSHAFGLDAPILVATLSAAGGPVMTVRFGAHNPDGFLQYMRIDGDPKVYLMSRFIGAEWLAAVDAMEAR